jgi:hypothetical protein
MGAHFRRGSPNYRNDFANKILKVTARCEQTSYFADHGLDYFFFRFHAVHETQHRYSRPNLRSMDCVGDAE